MENTVLFDPGIGELVIDFNEYNDVYSKLNTLKTPHQKRANFKLYFPKIKNAIENNIAFYIGCLTWAYIIKKDNVEKEILGNVFLNIPDEMLKDYDYLMQINFLKDYLKALTRDYSFYTGQKFNIPEQWESILNLYSEFLSINNGFIKTKTTKDLLLPELVANYKFEEDIENLMQKVISEKNLKLLIDNIKFPLKAWYTTFFAISYTCRVICVSYGRKR